MLKTEENSPGFMGKPNTSVAVKEVSSTQTGVPQTVQKQGALQWGK